MSWISTSNISPSTPQETSFSLLPARTLVTPRRLDLALKYRFFRHLIDGKDPEAETLYRWHIEARSGYRMRAGLATDGWKRSVDHYVISAKALCNAMAHEGFRPECAVPIDPDGELLGGAHRVACALALQIKEIPVARQSRFAWAPPWDEQWFRDNGMKEEDLARLGGDRQSLCCA